LGKNNQLLINMVCFSLEFCRTSDKHKNTSKVHERHLIKALALMLTLRWISIKAYLSSLFIMIASTS